MTQNKTSLQCPVDLIKSLSTLADAWNPHKRPNQFDPFYTGGCYHGTAFQVSHSSHAWNFKWKDIEVSWHPCLGHNMSINRKVSKEEIAELLEECLTELNNFWKCVKSMEQ